MKLLTTITNPFPAIDQIKIFAPETKSGRPIYPVQIDTLLVKFEKNDGQTWKVIGLTSFVSEDLKLFISNLIETL
jgi:hypothetical protein